MLSRDYAIKLHYVSVTDFTQNIRLKTSIGELWRECTVNFIWAQLSQLWHEPYFMVLSSTHEKVSNPRNLVHTSLSTVSSFLTATSLFIDFQ